MWVKVAVPPVISHSPSYRYCSPAAATEIKNGFYLSVLIKISQTNKSDRILYLELCWDTLYGVTLLHVRGIEASNLTKIYFLCCESKVVFGMVPVCSLHFTTDQTRGWSDLLFGCTMAVSREDICLMKNTKLRFT